jgi:hypothetical protein
MRYPNALIRVTRRAEPTAEGTLVQIVAKQVEQVALTDKHKMFLRSNCKSVRSRTILEHSATVRTIIHA